MVTDFLLIFILTAGISFVGSLQPGPVNLAVLHTALTGNKKQSILVAIGGVIPEVVYSVIALWFSYLFLTNAWLNNTIHTIAIIFFLIAGIYLLIKRNKTYSHHQKSSPKNKHFLFGLMAGLLNPMLLAFWIMILAVYNSFGLMVMRDTWFQAAFIAGTAAGAFVLLWLIAWYADCKKEAIFKFLPAHPARITGFVFIILAVWEAVKIMM